MMKLDQASIILFGAMPREIADPSRRPIFSLGEFSRFVEENNSVNDCFTSVYPLNDVIDKIFFDFDGKNALSDAQAVYRWATKEGYSVIPIASGKKGYHLHFLLRPKKYKDQKQAKELLYNASYYILGRVFEGRKDVSADPHVIGDVRRICRIPNTMRPPENLNYCTYIPADTFLTMDEMDMARHIKNVHAYDYRVETLSLPQLEDFPNIMKEQVCFSLTTDAKLVMNQVYDEMRPNEFLKRVLPPCLYNQIRVRNPDHQVRVAVVAHMLASGFTSFDIFKAFASLQWADWNQGTTEYQINKIKQRQTRPYSCKRLRELGIPKQCCAA